MDILKKKHESYLYRIFLCCRFLLVFAYPSVRRQLSGDASLRLAELCLKLFWDLDVIKKSSGCIKFSWFLFFISTRCCTIM